MRKLSILNIFLTCLVASLSAQAQTTIKGRFIDVISEAGIPGVSIEVKQTCTAGHNGPRVITLGSTTTGADGSYLLTYFPITNDPSCPSGLISTIGSKPGYHFGCSVGPDNESLCFATNLPPCQNVSAARYDGFLANEVITAAFGAGMALTTETATTLPLPTSLAGRSILVKDSQGVEKAAQLLYVSPSQINYVIPSELSQGAGTVKLIGDNGVTHVGFISLGNRVAPGIFTADANGQGAPAAVVQRTKADGTQSYEPVAQFDPAQNKSVPILIDLGPETDDVFLILFGTGIRFRAALRSVTVRLGSALNGANGQVTYAGPQGSYVGLDQVNVRLPRSLIGRGEIDLNMRVELYDANVVRISIK